MKNGFCVGEAVFVFSERFFSPYLETERKTRGKIELIWPSPSSGSRQASRAGELGRRVRSLGSSLDPTVTQLLNLSGPQFPHL